MQRVYDPTGPLEIVRKELAPRLRSLDGKRLAVINNTKWNAARLLEGTVSLLGEKARFAQVNRYKKETFTKPAGAELLSDISLNNDFALIAIAD